MKEKKASTWVLLRQLYGYFRRHKAPFLTVMACVLAANALELARPRILGLVVDRMTALAGAPERAAAAALTGGLWYLLAGLGSTLITYLYGRRRISLEQTVLCEMRTDLFSKIQSLSHRYHDENHSGGLITKATRDIDQVRIFFGDVAFEIVQFVLIIGGAFLVVLQLNWKLALLCYAVLPVTALLIFRAGRKLRDLYKQADDEYDGVTEILRENITGIRVVRAFGREAGEIGKFDGKVDSFFAKAIRSVDHFSFHLPLANCFFGLSTPLVLGFGGLMVMKGTVSLGDLTACMFYLSIITRKMRMMDKIVDRTQNAVASADRINGILNSEDGPPDGRLAAPARFAGRIRFEGVAFAYEPGKPVLHGLDLEIEPGETVAFVGPTGSGKSTAAMLLPRFYDVTGGAIRIDGTDIRDFRLAALRAQVGFVFQEPFLFSDSLRANIAYGRPEACAEEVEKAAREARIHDHAASLAEGYGTIIGERGITLSGGQKQRLTIARALLTDPPILVLDDCTSSLDAVTEREIREAMETTAKRRTTIIIAQRISTVRRADKIVVFDRGRIVQTGRHEELIGMEGMYRDLFLLQSFSGGPQTEQETERTCLI